eukprot:12933516-Alexandrium_andersonii.AAC.1
MQNRFTRSNLELRGPKNASKLVPEALDGCILRCFARRFRIRSRKRASTEPEVAKSGCRRLQSAIRQS